LKTNRDVQSKDNDSLAAIGIGAMIVFIALILVAAVAAAVIIQTAEKLQQNAQTTGQDTTEKMAARVTVLSIIITDAASDELTMTFELAPGSTNVPTGDIVWAIVCTAGIDDDDLLETVATHEVGDAATAAGTIEAGKTYVTTITPATCTPAANAQHTILLQAGGGGQTYEVLNYGGDVGDGAVVV
jgi:archaellin